MAIMWGFHFAWQYRQEGKRGTAGGGSKVMLDNTKRKRERGRVKKVPSWQVNFIVFMIATKCKKSKNQINYSNVPGILIRAGLSNNIRQGYKYGLRAHRHTRTVAHTHSRRLAHLIRQKHKQTETAGCRRALRDMEGKLWLDASTHSAFSMSNLCQSTLHSLATLARTRSSHANEPKRPKVPLSKCFRQLQTSSVASVGDELSFYYTLSISTSHSVYLSRSLFL